MTTDEKIYDLNNSIIANHYKVIARHKSAVRSRTVKKLEKRLESATDESVRDRIKFVLKHLR